MNTHRFLIAAGTVLGLAVRAFAMEVREGQALPEFTLKSRGSDQAVQSSQWKGKATAIVFARPDQPKSQAALKDVMLARRELEKLPWNLVVVVSGEVTNEAVSRLIEQTGFEGTVLLDPDMSVYGQFGVIVMPSTVVVDRRMKIVLAKASHDFEYQRLLSANIQYATGLVDQKGRENLIRTPGEKDDDSKTRLARWVHLAQSLARTGELDHAQATLQRVLEQEPNYQPARVELGFVLLQKDQAQEALKCFQQAESQNAPTPSTQLGSGIALMKLNRLEEADQKLKNSLNLSPRPALGHYALGRLYEQQGRTAEAAAQFKAAAKVLLDKEEGWRYEVLENKEQSAGTQPSQLDK